MAETLCTWEAPYGVDTIEWNDQLRVAAVGLYQLEEGSGAQQRTGGVSLLAWDEETLQEQDLWSVGAGVLDLRWVGGGGGSPLVVATCSDGRIRAINYADGSTTSMAGSAELGLGLAVETLGDEQVACSFSSGALAVFQWNDRLLDSIPVWQVNGLESHRAAEAWTITIGTLDAGRVYSGGDDGSWCAWDTRINGTNGPMLRTSNAHQRVGVTTLTTHPTRPNVLCSGGYDDIVRVWDLRKHTSAIQTSECNLGGGVWRLKHHPTNPDLLLAATMYDGFKIVRLRDSSSCPQTVLSYEKQGSIGYGAAWIETEGNRLTAITGSFYNKAVHVWSGDLKSV